MRVRLARNELPIARIFGLIDTDLGDGLVTELIESAPGVPAPTLSDHIARHGLDAEVMSAVDALVQRIIACGIVVNDLRTANLACRRCVDGRLELILIDGFGDKNVIPRLSLIAWLNRRNTHRRVDRLLAELRRKAAIFQHRASNTARPSLG